MSRHKGLRLGLVGLLCAIAMPLAMAPSAQADRLIIIRSPSQGERHSHEERYPHEESRSRRSEHHRYPSRYPIYERRQPVQRQVTVEFIAQGDEWANVYVDGRRIFSPTNYANRRQRFTFREGAYDIKITGVDFFDVWAEGYLDVGRDDTNIIVVSFSERGGIRVSGDSNAWIPVSARR
ncbi:hypothetical protein [Leptothoe sp. PORK10 BA2]|uniref:hypothetical protein n=1 Tax=Leptothoe sp. PORK10 BA2 TaxID=3110254 RepID=UPI002B1F3B96|nr:hypothetical protein [Leptothoe sp. PORK10 BA2]MEA5466723.1 hypothetical protein [Leptothoe sp. PORK10 BA2]